MNESEKAQKHFLFSLPWNKDYAKESENWINENCPIIHPRNILNLDSDVPYHDQNRICIALNTEKECDDLIEKYNHRNDPKYRIEDHIGYFVIMNKERMLAKFYCNEETTSKVCNFLNKEESK